MMHIKDKVAVIIGGAQGIGRAYASELLQRGAKIVIGDIKDATATETVKDLAEKYDNRNILFKHCNIVNEKEIKALFDYAIDNFREVDIFANSSGAIDEFDWKTPVDVNYGGVIRSSMIALEYMGKHKNGKGGVIVHTSSRTGIRGSYNPVYAGSKAAVIWYCRSFAKEEHFEESGVRFNAVAPCVVDTKFRENFVEGKVYFPEKMAANHALGMILPEQCALALVSLVEDDALNGHVMVCSKQRGNFLDKQNMEYKTLN